MRRYNEGYKYLRSTERYNIGDRNRYIRLRVFLFRDASMSFDSASPDNENSKAGGLTALRPPDAGGVASVAGVAPKRCVSPLAQKGADRRDGESLSGGHCGRSPKHGDVVGCSLADVRLLGRHSLWARGLLRSQGLRWSLRALGGGWVGGGLLRALHERRKVVRGVHRGVFEVRDMKCEE